MKYPDLKKAMRHTPFQACVIWMENGEAYVVTHPEQVSLHENLCFWSDDKSWALFNAAQVTAVTSVEPPDGRNRKGRRRASR